MSDLRFTPQEIKIINFLMSKNNSEIAYEELVQFSKDPKSVKIKTVKKSISEIKRKYLNMNLMI